MALTHYLIISLQRLWSPVLVDRLTSTSCSSPHESCYRFGPLRKHPALLMQRTHTHDTRRFHFCSHRSALKSRDATNDYLQNKRSINANSQICMRAMRESGTATVQNIQLLYKKINRNQSYFIHLISIFYHEYFVT